MLCAISGETPQVPVVSAKSGTVFEKRLIEAYIAEHGNDPVTGEELTVADLIELKSPRIVKPRPPTLTSIPSLLSVFQNEWDALALETFTLRQQLVQTRQELSNALYQHDAAVRVIARLMKERDEAREALSKVSIGAVTGAGAGDEMQIDHQGLPQHIVEKVTKAFQELSSTRKKRPIPHGWVSAEQISTFDVLFTSDELYPGAKSLALDKTGEFAVLGGLDGIAGIYSLNKRELLAPLKAGDGAITDVAWFGLRPITASTSGVIRLWNETGENSVELSSHAGEVTSVAVHPCGDILGSVGADKAWVLHDLATAKTIFRAYVDQELTVISFHPDGHLVALGTSSGSIEIYNVRDTTYAATFGSLAGPIQSISFSENGYWLACSIKDDSTITIWDLRKAVITKTIDTGNKIESIRWDYSGQFLLSVGPSGINVQFYDKGKKDWSSQLEKGIPGAKAEWGTLASSIVGLSKEGVLTVLGIKE